MYEKDNGKGDKDNLNKVIPLNFNGAFPLAMLS
jgi:hypothetical protein